MKPSDIDLSLEMPLGATFGRVEAEAMAAFLITALVVNGDEWKPLLFTTIAATVAELDPVPAWCTNPFYRADPCALCDRGFATVFGEGDARALGFTPRGLAALEASPWNLSA